MALGYSAIVDRLAKVIPLEFHIAVGENVGWLNEMAKNEKYQRKCHWIKLLIDFFEKNHFNLYENDLVKISWRLYWDWSWRDLCCCCFLSRLRYEYEMRMRWIYWRWEIKKIKVIYWNLFCERKIFVDNRKSEIKFSWKKNFFRNILQEVFDSFCLSSITSFIGFDNY